VRKRTHHEGATRPHRHSIDSYGMTAQTKL
jgi:hypothetical protein